MKLKLSKQRHNELEEKYERAKETMSIEELAEYFRYLFEINIKTP